jgi:hypothetical protein
MTPSTRSTTASRSPRRRHRAQTVAIGRAMDGCALTLLAAATAGVVIVVFVAG